MDKVPGVELERFWPEMSIEDRFAVVKTIASYQIRWALTSFEKFGSLYFRVDLNKNAGCNFTYTNHDGVRKLDNRFAIGLSSGREFFDDGRSLMDFDRGPCMT